MRIYTCYAPSGFPTVLYTQTSLLINTGTKLKYPHIIITSDLPVSVLQNKIKTYLDELSLVDGTCKLLVTSQDITVVQCDIDSSSKEEGDNTIQSILNSILQSDTLVESYFRDRATKEE